MGRPDLEPVDLTQEMLKQPIGALEIRRAWQSSETYAGPAR